MHVSQARIDANRRNAQLSSGPKTPEGKAKSRVNALKHGLCASVVVPEGLDLIRRRSTEFYDTLKPQNEVHVWMVDQAALCSIRIDRCQRIERRVRDKISLRAELTWDVDRRFEVEVTARSLDKDPSATVEALRRTQHGCEWMIKRWAMLAYAADTQNATWTDDQTRLAFDLLATPSTFREGKKPGILLDDDGRVVDRGDDPAGVARREIALLKQERDFVSDLDEAERHLASSDLVNEGDPELRRLRRYESMLHTRIRWCIKQIDIQSPYRLPDPTLRPQWFVDPETADIPQTPPAEPAETPVPAAAEAIELPVAPQPEPEDIDETTEDVPTALSSRREKKKIRRAAARAEGRRRKSDRLRS